MPAPARTRAQRTIPPARTLMLMSSFSTTKHHASRDTHDSRPQPCIASTRISSLCTQLILPLSSHISRTSYTLHAVKGRAACGPPLLYLFFPRLPFLSPSTSSPGHTIRLCIISTGFWPSAPTPAYAASAFGRVISFGYTRARMAHTCCRQSRAPVNVDLR